MTQPDDASVADQLRRAARDLWSSVLESGDDYVVLMDRRRLSARVQRTEGGLYEIGWEADEGNEWITHGRLFDNPREAAFHAFQGPH